MKRDDVSTLKYLVKVLLLMKIFGGVRTGDVHIIDNTGLNQAC